MPSDEFKSCPCGKGEPQHCNVHTTDRTRDRQPGATAKVNVVQNEDAVVRVVEAALRWNRLMEAAESVPMERLDPVVEAHAHVEEQFWDAVRALAALEKEE